jgi:hypothetical protein
MYGAVLGQIVYDSPAAASDCTDQRVAAPANPRDSVHSIQKEDELPNHCHTAFSAAAKRIPAFVSCS